MEDEYRAAKSGCFALQNRWKKQESGKILYEVGSGGKARKK
jgi:hypothetical protein